MEKKIPIDRNKITVEERLVDIPTASELTGYSKGHIRNLVYKGILRNYGKKSDEKKNNGILKRGSKMRISLTELSEKVGIGRVSA